MGVAKSKVADVGGFKDNVRTRFKIRNTGVSSGNRWSRGVVESWSRERGRIEVEQDEET